VDPIARATRLHEAGRTAMAINQLRRLPPTDPLYEEAQALISQWEASGQQPEAAEAGSEAPSPEALGRRAELVAEAEQALGRGENLAALDALDAAAAVAPLDEPEAALRSTAEAALAPLAAALDLYRDGQYERALPQLWRLREEEQDNLDLRRLIVDSYYNLAVRDLQRGDAKGAAGKLREALELVENDPELERHLRFAETYEKRNKDLLYRIYVKYLPLR
jgi:tetratricopeptide (TPR) repeat protein